MSDNQPTLTTPDSDQPATEPTAVPPPAVAQTPDSQPTAEGLMIPKSRFDEVNKELKALRAAQDKAEKERQEAERKALEEQNNFKALYEKAEESRREAEARAAQLAHDSTRQRIASAAGQAELWDRLRGETEEELQADMESLLKLLPKPATPFPRQSSGGAPATTNVVDATLNKRYAPAKRKGQENK